MACGTSRVAQRVVTLVMRAWAKHHELTERGRGFDQPSRSTSCHRDMISKMPKTAHLNEQSCNIVRRIPM